MVKNVRSLSSKAKESAPKLFPSPTPTSSPKVPPSNPNELIVKLKTSSPQFKTKSGVASQSINITELDVNTLPETIKHVHQKYSLQKINRLFVKSPDLSGYYLLTFNQSVNPQQTAKFVSSDPLIDYAEPNYQVQALFTPNDPFFTKQWALHNTGQTGGTADSDIDAPEAWNITQGTASTIIAIIDTGIDYTHSDLGGCLGPNCKVVGGYDFVNSDADPMDDQGHGTNCAGIATAKMNNNQGVSGVCPNCRLLAVKFLNAQGSGSTSDALLAIEYAVNSGAKVLSNSWGGGGYSQAMQDLVNWSISKGDIFIAAAGNEGIETKSYPASLDNVISVAATTNTDVKASYSSYDSSVDLSAPGGEVSSTGCRYPYQQAILSTITTGSIWSSYGSACGLINNGAKYIGLAGTSMAAPHVAGVAGLVFSKNPTWKAWQVMGQVKYSTDNIYPKNPLYSGKLGTGRLNAYSALTAKPAPKIIVASLSPNDSQSTWPNGLVEPGESLKLTINLRNEWQNATNISTVLSTTNSYLTITQSKSAYPNLVSGDTKPNTTLFELTINPSTPPGSSLPLNFKITYKNTANKILTTNLTLSLPVTSDLGWPKLSENIIPTSGTLVDLDFNGTNEVLLESESGLNAYDSSGRLMWKFTDPNSTLFKPSVAVGDLIGDKDQEIVITSQTDAGISLSTIYILNSHGALLKQISLPNTSSLITPVLANTDSDHYPEIIIGTNSSTGFTPSVKVFKPDGQLLWEHFGPDQYITGLTVGNLDASSSAVIVSNYTNYDTQVTQLLVTRTNDGQNIIPPIQEEYGYFSGSPLIADLDHDGLAEIIALSSSYSNGGKIQVFQSNGTPKYGWPQTISSNSIYNQHLVVGDIDSDQNLELFIDNQNGLGMGFRHNGTPLPGWPVNLGFGTISTPLIVNLNSDPNLEIIFPTMSDCALNAFNSAGQSLPDYPILLKSNPEFCFITQIFSGKMGSNQNLYLGITDQNNFGSTFYLVDTHQPYQNSSAGWPIFLHDNQRTSYFPPLAPPTPIPAPTETPNTCFCSNGKLTASFCIRDNFPVCMEDRCQCSSSTPAP